MTFKLASFVSEKCPEIGLCVQIGQLRIAPAYSCSPAAAHLPQWLKEWATQTLALNHTALYTGHNNPDVAKCQKSKQEAPDQCQRDAKDGRQEAITMVCRLCECDVAGFPHLIDTAYASRLCNHIFKVDLRHTDRVHSSTVFGYVGLKDHSLSPFSLAAQCTYTDLIIRTQVQKSTHCKNPEYKTLFLERDIIYLFFVAVVKCR